MNRPCWPRLPGDPGERGSAAVAVAGVIGVVTALVIGACVVVAVVRDLHRARAAADLAALAAASPLRQGGAPDCAAARRVATAMGAALQECTALPDASVIIVVGVTGRWPQWPGVPQVVRGQARAGVSAA